MESSSYQISRAKYFKVVPRFLEKLCNPAAYISRSKLVHLLILASIRAVHNTQNPRNVRSFISLLTPESAASLWPQNSPNLSQNCENIKAKEHRMVANIWTTRTVGLNKQEWYNWQFDTFLCRSLTFIYSHFYLGKPSLVHTAYSRTVRISKNNQMLRLWDQLITTLLLGISWHLSAETEKVLSITRPEHETTQPLTRTVKALFIRPRPRRSVALENEFHLATEFKRLFSGILIEFKPAMSQAVCRGGPASSLRQSVGFVVNKVVLK